MSLAPANVIPFPDPKRLNNYSVGYANGLRDGERWASQKLFWLGVGAGILMSGLILLALVVGGVLR